MMAGLGHSKRLRPFMTKQTSRKSNEYIIYYTIHKYYIYMIYIWYIYICVCYVYIYNIISAIHKLSLTLQLEGFVLISQHWIQFMGKAVATGAATMSMDHVPSNGWIRRWDTLKLWSRKDFFPRWNGSKMQEPNIRIKQVWRFQRILGMCILGAKSSSCHAMPLSFWRSCYNKPLLTWLQKDM